MDRNIRAIIEEQFTAISRKKFETLNEISLNAMALNPFLLRLMGFQTAEEIAEFLVNQKLERSVVTSYGARIQTIAKEISGRGTGVEGADICKEREGRRYYIQMKAGPNTINKDISQQINTLLSSATRRNQGSVALLGMTYGKRENVSHIIQSYSSIDWLVGREFWEFISDDPNCAKEIFDIIEHLVMSLRFNGMTYREFHQNTVNRLAGEITERYGAGPEMWNLLFNDNM